MKSKVLVLASALLAAGVASAASIAAGSCPQKAIALKASQAITLVNGYDPELKENWDSGVIYYKVSLVKGQSATIWISGGDATSMDFWEADYNWDDFSGEDDILPDVNFDEDFSRDDGATKGIYLHSDSWGDDDPSRITFYISIYGDIGQKCNLYYSPKIETFTTEGEEGNPRLITMTENSQKDVRNLIDGEFYYTVLLEAGRKYSIRTTGGAAKTPLTIDMGEEFLELSGFSEVDPAYSNNTANASLLIYPEQTAYYTFHVSGLDKQAFNLKYWAYPARLPASHPSTELTTANNYTAKGVPGRVRANDKADRSYYDDVIDEFLLRIRLAKGERWIFESSGSTSNIQMQVYDSTGAVLAKNDSLGNYSRDVRAAVKATYDGYYYVGVCNPVLADWDATPKSPTVSVIARNADEITGQGNLDSFDRADDAWGGASLLVPALGTADGSAVAIGEAHGPHVLSGGDWYDWYAVPCRSNLTYVLKAAFAGEETTNLKLFAKVYRLVDGVLTQYKNDIRGSLTPAEADLGTMQFTFTPDSNGTYYIRVSVAEGIGLDYPAYTMHAMVYGTGDLGLVKVNTMGVVGGTWYFTDDSSALYPGGATVAVPVGVRNIRYSADAAYTTPAKEKLTVKSWNSTSNVTEATGWYVDIADPADDARGGAVALAPTAKSRKVKRTLWAQNGRLDKADWYKFAAQRGVYYNFWIEDTTGGNVGGDAVLAIFNGSSTQVYPPANQAPVKEVARWTPAAGTYYIRVNHSGASAVDTTYRLWYSSANVGVIGFASTSINVSEAASYVDVQVNRSASEGAVRVNYATTALTAEPGKEYYPTNGILEWADGDQSPKTIRVYLIPDLIESYDVQKKFKVNIWPIANDGLEDGEYPAAISGSTFTTVKIKESSAQNPGTIVASAPDPLEVTAGETLRVTFSRVDGSDGKIAVKVKTQSSTATMGTNGSADFDYANKILEWKDGETADKVFEVKTTACKKPADDKQMRLKLSTLATGKYAGNLVPRLAESKIYIPIRNPINAGTIVLVSPDPRLVVAGEKLRAVFSRVGGSNGKIAVKVKTQSSTATMGTNGSADFDYVKDVLEWADGDTADKVFEVPTTACKKFEPNKQLRLKLSTLATGAYKGNFTPTLAESKIYVTIWNQLAPASAKNGPVAKLASGKDAYGNAISADKPIQLVQGVYANFTLGATTGAATVCKVVQGELPPGMSVQNLRILGVPSKVGNYKALVQVFNGNVAGTTMEFNFHVADADLAFGTFSGVLTEEGDTSLTNKMPRVGSISFTATETGSLSAKVKIGASNYKFTGSTGYARADTRGLPDGLDRFMVVTLRNAVTLGSNIYTNFLVLTVADASSTNLTALGTCAGTVSLTLNVLDGIGGVQEEILYSGELIRNNSQIDAYLDAVSGFVGYYTLALAPEGVSLADGVPAGNGYLTVMVADDGIATCGGLLADGTAISCSGPVAVRGDLTDPASCKALIPVFQKTTPWSFGGLMALRSDGTFDSRTALEWNKDGNASSYDRQGFTLALLPTGGWYDTVVNLQTYYLNLDLSVKAEPVTGLPPEMLPSGRYGLNTLPHDLPATLDRNVLSVPARKLVMRTDLPSLIDFAESVNPWKVKVAFERGSGVVSGTFQALSISSTASATIGTYKHYGVLIMNRDAASPLDADVWTAGFGLVPVSSAWTLSIPFNIRSVAVDRDWSELEVPAAK